MSDFTLPNLLCPFPPALHPAVDQVEREAVARWARRMDISPDSKAFMKLERSQFAKLVCHAHPRAQLSHLHPVVDFLFFIFLWDDQFDCRIGGELPDPASLAMSNLLASAVLQGSSPNEDSSPLLWALSDLRDWLSEHMSQAWMDRFTQSFQDYFDSTVWELEARHQGVCPDLDTYIRMRRLTSGGYWVTHLIEAAEGFCLSDEAWNNPLLQEILTATANIIGWANDLLSLRSELNDTGHLNLVFSLMHERGLSLQQAVNEAVEMHNSEVRRFLELERSLSSSNQDPLVSRFVRGLRLWMRANIDWSILTGRYQVEVDEVLPAPTPEALAAHSVSQ